MNTKGHRLPKDGRGAALPGEHVYRLPSKAAPGNNPSVLSGPRESEEMDGQANITEPLQARR